MLRLILFGLAAAGAYWYFTRYQEDKELADRQSELPSGIRLLPKDEQATKPTEGNGASKTAAAKTPATAAKPKAPTPSVPAKPGKTGAKDDLTIINGIGKVFAQRLNEAGIHTFADLAAQTPDRLREITQAKEWQKVDPQTWIDQAKQQAK